MKVITYDNLAEMLDDIETLLIETGAVEFAVLVDSLNDANRPYGLRLTDEDYDELWRRKRTKK